METCYTKDAHGNIKEFVIGETRVILTCKDYSACRADPVWSSEYACVGIITKLTGDRKIPFTVKWDNGGYNVYRGSDLLIHLEQKATPNPNMSFKRHRRKNK